MDIEALPFETRLLVSDVTSIFRSNAERKGIVLGASVAPDVPVAMVGDPSRLRQILANYLNNAVKFTEAGRIDLSLTVRDAADGADTRRLHFAVTDTGIGIADDVKPALFMPFMQADSSVTRKYGGTGLGLAICRKLVELMGGRLWLESEEGAGSRFHFTAVFGECVDGELSPSPSRRDLSAPDVSGHRILLAEDNPVNQMVVSKMLGKLGLTVVAVANGVAAVEAWKGGAFDVVLMDVQMPEMDGYDATMAIRALEAGSSARTPILALTANAMKGDRERCLAAGMDDHIAKPVLLADLVAALERVLLQPR